MGRAPKRLQIIADRLTRTSWHNGVAMSLYDRSTGREYHVGSGALDSRTPYFATGTTKLYTTSILLQLIEEGKIGLDDPFLTYLGHDKQYEELLVREGVDYTDRVTIRHLMSHTSGFGDFFLYKYQARTLKHAIGAGVDTAWSFDEVVQRSRSHGAVAVPGQSRKALYTDTNFHMLGRVIEAIEGENFGEVLRRRVIDRLGLTSTYLYCDPSDTRPINFMSKDREVRVPRTMASFQADGGIVTTSREALIFIRGFFEGYLFDKRILPRLYHWRPMYFPTEYGVGLMQIKVPWWMSLPHRLNAPPSRFFKSAPRSLGHMGLGGTICLYAPEAGVYIAGTVNQLLDPARSVIASIKMIEDVAYGGREDGAHRRGAALVGSPPAR
ncbi:serine hydrolase domain-containing protein [Celeribacter baekdonensis]|uniref:Alkaline D-peptidase and alkaline D-peptidase fusion n=1 Tax=Celeribacter baekdonensis B30 TaxID=1208323 RepID=K2JEC3_9RHOB|nr:serine hydrolase domain-containing protein [Celeribacter baekdonensis]EKE73463.1 alkaline D-peptidase and alkaline D-peptidase fusion [Celeribacter baekdonensis B30]